MSSFEWMELQTLTGDINASRSRLAQARASKDHRLIRVLETEIATAEGRRDRLLSYISTHLAGTAEPVAEEPARSTDATPAALAEAPEPELPAEPPPAETLQPPGGGEASPGEIVEVRSGEGVSVVWEQLTPTDIERAQNQIGIRRTEMLARHTEELKALEADQNELESLEQAVQTFVRRFKPAAEPVPEAAIVKLGAERELRAQVRG